ncbi:LamG domain-containing protein [Desulforhopalus singaporensis]|uniref:WD40-like Beta Propeller Repeat n=1 Tax=Desulforhopalus singaporensis TaxID=91360 RepID=A0A1H0T0W8_9BACT|nr:hypothetical protein [Desulforhopalus singaporensis]SDP47168.1 hypothetical protein SAMN05660330_02876 [Desulforhopalus singaporensis]
MNNRLFTVVVGCILFFASGLAVCPVQAGGKNLGEWTGRHSRVVWVQDHGDGSDTFGRSDNLMLYGYDSVDGRGERPLVAGKSNYFKPLFTPDGNNVIVSDRLQRKIYLVEWASGKKKELGSGVAVAVWQDPQPGWFFGRKTTWIYCFDGNQKENKYGTSQPLYRFPLNRPHHRELVWDKSDIAWSSLQLSRDGEVIGGLFPWPHGGVLQGDEKSFKRLGRGCWSSLSPDNSKLLWIFDGLHRNVQIHDVRSGDSWMVNISSAPGVRDLEVYHPRWSNHPRYFVLTGPYEKGEGGNRVGGGGENVEVYVGRFDEKVQSVEDWLQLTHNGRADFYPEMWIEGGERENLVRAAETQVLQVEKNHWPVAPEAAVFAWENMKAENQLTADSPLGFYQCNLELRGNALFARDYSLLADGGWGETVDGGKKIGESLAVSGNASVSLVIYPEKKQRASIFSLVGSDGFLLELRQESDQLVLVGRFASQGEQIVVWPAVLDRPGPISVSLTLDGLTAELFIDGKSAGEKVFAAGFGAFSRVDRLVAGDMQGRFSGKISSLAVHNRRLSGGEIEAGHAMVAKKQQPLQEPASLVVEAQLLETTDIPDPDSIGAYRRALVVNSYEVQKVIAGEYKQQKILVAEWAVLDRKIVKQYPEESETERLFLQKFDLHPELEGERQMMDVFEPDLDMYYRLPATELRR